MRTLIITFAFLEACGSPPTQDELPPGTGSQSGPSHGFTSTIISPPVVSGGIPTLTNLGTGIPGTESGQTLNWNGTAWQLGKYTNIPSQRYWFVEEFETGSTCATIGKFSGAVTGTGASCTFTSSDANHPGVLAMTTGTLVTSGDRFETPPIIQFGAGTGTYCAKQLIKFQNVGTSVDQFVFRAGFIEPLGNSDSVDAVEIVYQFSVDGASFSFETSSNSTTTKKKMDGTGGTVNQPVSAGVWYTLEECVAGDGSSATAKINGVLSATITTNIPTGSARTTDLGVQCFNDSGSIPAAQICYIDYFEATLPFGVAR